MNGLQAFVLGKKYTDETAEEFGALKGAPCTIKSIVHVNKQNIVTFEWKNSDGEIRESTMVVEDGEDGTGVYATYADLPVLTSEDRTVVYVESDACFYFWDGTNWIPQQADISALTNEQINNLISLL